MERELKATLCEKLKQLELFNKEKGIPSHMWKGMTQTNLGLFWGRPNT